jgi:aldose sugar dehydrogenase
MSSSKDTEINILIRRSYNFQYLFLLGETIIGLVIFTSVFNVYSPVHGEENPIVKDKHLVVELVVEGLKLPTAMDFLGPGDILVLEKDNGTVRRVINGTLLPHPILDVGVATERERGMLGIAVAKKTEIGLPQTRVFIYYTQSETSEDGLDDCPPPRPYYCKQDGEPLGNRLYRYEFANDKLVNPKLLLDLPANPGPNHNGGVLLIGPDKNIYIIVGDVLPYYSKELGTKAANFRDSGDPDGRSGILRVTQEGNTVENGILGDKHPLNKYYAYGIRNGFGMDFDPVTGKLWDTENGPGYGDEINLVEPGFNSGWAMIQGLWSPRDLDRSENILNLFPGNRLIDSEKSKLSNFNGKGKYSDPDFIWNQTIGVTALKFFDSDKLGTKYKNDLFVGDITFGNIYHFDLNKNRTELILKGELGDKIAERIKTDQKSIKFGENFGGISDLEVGPYDGYLYVLSYHDGSIYRISPEK